MKRSIRAIVVVYSCFALLGCVTVQPRLKLKVDKVDASGVHGAGQHVAYDDIDSISLAKYQAGRTVLIALGIAAVAAAAGGGGGGGSGY